jgi:O-antigen/teichoic acid export membrane protein
MLQKLRKSSGSVVIYSIGNLSAKLTGFILLPLYTEHLSVADYGTLGLLETISQFLAAVLALSLPTALLRWCSSENDEKGRKSIVFTTLMASLAILGVFNIIAYPVTSFINHTAFWNDPKFSLYLMLSFPVITFDILNLLVLNLLRFHERPGLYITINTAKLAAILGLNIYFISYKGMGVDGVILSQFIGSLALNLLSLPFLVRNLFPRFNYKILKELLIYGFPLVFASISALILSMGDRFIIDFFLTKEDLGVYTLGYRIGGVINVFILQSFQLGFLPFAYKMFEEGNAQRFFSKVLTYFTFVLIFSALVLSVFARETIITFAHANSGYWSAYIIVPLISLSFVIKGLQYYFSLGLHYVKRTGYNAWIVMVCAVVSLGLNFLLIPVLGILGSAFTINIATLLMAWLYFHFSQKFYPINFEYVRILKLFGVGLGIFLLSLPAARLGWWPGIALKALLLFSYPFLLYFAGFFESIELLRLRQGWEKWKKPSKWKSNLSK